MQSTNNNTAPPKFRTHTSTMTISELGWIRYAVGIIASAIMPRSPLRKSKNWDLFGAKSAGNHHPTMDTTFDLLVCWTPRRHRSGQEAVLVPSPCIYRQFPMHQPRDWHRAPTEVWQSSDHEIRFVRRYEHIVLMRREDEDGVRGRGTTTSRIFVRMLHAVTIQQNKK